MVEPTSHNEPLHRRAVDTRSARPALDALLAAIVLLGAALFCLELVAASELTRILDVNLERLADPAAWTR